MFTKWKIHRLEKKIKVMQANRVNNQPSDEVLKKEVGMYLDLARIYKKMKCSIKFPYSHLMYRESLRGAANLDDAEANYQLGKLILDEAKFREHLQKETVLHSDVNQNLCKTLYDEAHAYLFAATGMGHIEAKRLRGLSFINGWGLAEDKKTGFELVVDSIEQEGAWDKVPQIFAAMGLNKPEFFAEIMQRRRK